MITYNERLKQYLVVDPEDTSARHVVPRVSQIAGLLDPGAYQFVKDSAMVTASRRGTWVHEAIDRFHTAGRWELGNYDVDSVTAPYYGGYMDFLSDTGAEPLEGEKVVYHRTYRYAGRLDKLFRIQGRLTVVDFKVTAAMPKTVWVQLAAYMEAENDAIKAILYPNYPPLITDRAALRLKPNEKYQLRRPSELFAEDLRVFLALLQILRWKEKQSNGYKPKF